MIDTLKISEELLKLGFPPEQAKGLARIQAESIDAEGGPVTKDYLNLRLKAELEPIRTELTWFRWILGLVLALLVGLYFKH